MARAVCGRSAISRKMGAHEFPRRRRQWPDDRRDRPTGHSLRRGIDGGIPDRRRAADRRRRRVLRPQGRQDHRHGRRKRQRQVGFGAGPAGAAAAQRPGRRRPGHVPGHGPAEPSRRRTAAPPGQPHRHGVPGAHDGAQSGLQHRRPDRRGPPDPSAAFAGRGVGPGRRHAAPGGHPRPRHPGARLPPSIVGRHAAAGGHRHGAGLRAGHPDRRRGDDGAGRDRPGANPRIDNRPAAGIRHGRPVHQPRPGRGVGPRRRRGRPLCGPGHGTRPGIGVLRPAHAPLQPGHAGNPAVADAARARPADDPGNAARSRPAAGRVPVRAPVPPGRRRLPGRGAAVDGNRRGELRGLYPPGPDGRDGGPA